MPLILPGNVASATAAVGYDVANSCMFNDGDSAYMHVTRGSAGNQKTFTISMWIKRCELGASNYFFTVGPDGDTNFVMYFNSADLLEVWQYSSAAYQFRLKPTKAFRDISAWYHICVAIDTTDATADDRVKIYINGVQETTMTTRTNPSEDLDTVMNDDRKYWLGNYVGTSNYFDGYIAELVVLDGTAASPTSFGEFDSDSPRIWKPIDVSGLTFGTNGFYLDFEASDNLGNDANGGTDWTEVNLAATDQMSDSPTNNFATLNPLNKGTGTFSEGNLGWAGDSNWRTALSTIAVAKGKWYAEFKWSSGDYKYIGINGIDTATQATDSSDAIGNQTPSISHPQSGVKFINGASTSYGDAYDATSGLIIGVAMDLDNHKLYFSHNNTWQNSGDPESGATGTGAITIATTDTSYVFGCSDYNGLEYANFGSPPYANSSDAADANGYGAFEYAPPSGYFALCTKNLAEYG